MTDPGDDYESEKITLTEEQQELMEVIEEWDEEMYPLAKHARRALKKRG